MTETINVAPIHAGLTAAVRDLMGLGEPYIRVRGESDYWLYATLFSTTCPVATVDGVSVGAVIAFRSQDDPTLVYVQDVMVHPEHRNAGVATAMISHLQGTATALGCRQIWLTSEAGNEPAHRTWTKLGFTNNTGDFEEDGLLITRDLKGPGKHRAVYRKLLSQANGY